MKEHLSQSALTNTASNSLKEISNSSVASSSVSVSQSDTPSERDGIYAAKRVLVQRNDSETSATTSSTVTSEENWPPKLNRYPAYPMPDLGKSFSTENSKPVRRFSEDLLISSERPGNDELDFRPYGASRGMTYATQQHLRRIAMETQALRQKEEERRIEQERRAVDRQRIEQELAKTKSELEREESIEDLLAKQNYDIMGRIPDGSSKYSDYGSKADSTSITSDYSTTSSTAYGTDVKHSLPTRLGNVSDYSSSASPTTSVRNDRPRFPGITRPIPYGAHRGRLDGDESTTKTVASAPYSWGSADGNTKDNCHSTRDDMELYRQHPHRNAFDAQKVATKGTLVRKKSSSSTRTQQEDSSRDYSAGLTRSGSMKRKGSLDSLRDFYDMPEPNPYLSSESENGDLLESLTSTFDEKLKVLSSPKSQFDPPTSKRTPPVGSESSPSVASPIVSTQQTPSGQDMDTTNSSSPSSYDSSFQNPSLHKVRDGSISSRFDRNKSPNDRERSPAHRQTPSPGSGSSAGGGRWGAPTSLGLHRDMSDASLSGRNGSPKRDSQTFGAGSLVPDGVDTSLKRWEREGQDYAAQLRKSSEKLYGSREKLLEVAPAPPTNGDKRNGFERKDPVGEVSQNSSQGVRLRSYSPPARRKEPKKVRRRHTVGGSSDFDHVAALETVNQESRRSAWERLQPAVSPTEGEAKSIRDWCEKERLRGTGSLPAIIGLTLQPAPGLSQEPSPWNHRHDPSHPRCPLEDDRRQEDIRYYRSQSQPASGSSPTTPTYTSNKKGRSTFTFESSI